MKFTPALSTLVSQQITLGIVPALMGNPAIGKSSFFLDVADKLDSQCFVLQCNNLSDKADLTGVRTVQDETTGNWRQRFFPHEDVMAAVEYAEAHPDETVILNLDEINRTNSDITSALLTMPTARRLGGIKFPDNLAIAVTGNLDGDVTPLDEASISRFAILEVEADADTFIGLHDDLNPWIKAQLEDRPDLIFCRATPTEVAVDGTSDDPEISSIDDLLGAGEATEQITAPRTLKHLSDWLNLADRTQLTNMLATPTTVRRREITLLDSAVESLIGNTEFSTLLIARIADDLRQSTPSQSVSLAQPVGYDALKAATSLSELTNAVTDMEPAERSAALVFALSEVDDNTRVIEQLAAQLPRRLERDDMRNLTKMLSDQQTYLPNVETLMNSQTDIGSALQPMLSGYVE